MFRSNPKIDRAIDLLRLSTLYWQLAHGSECPRNRFALALDLLQLFFEYRTFPDNYGPCRLWEVPKSEWKYYYGSNYATYQRAALTRQMQPPRYAILFQDKAVCDRLCRHGWVNLPRTYGVVRPEGNYRESILAYLSESSPDGLIVKPLVGTGGRGIAVVSRQGDGVVACSRAGEVPLDEYTLTEDAVVQEMIRQDGRMAALSLRSLNTIRVTTMLTKEENVVIVLALLRCGIGGSYVDNWSAGGLCVGVDIDTGSLRPPAYDKTGKRYARHPTTDVPFSGFVVPEWARILDAAVKTQMMFPFYRMLGVDIGLGEHGVPMLVEVNGSPDLGGSEQSTGPLFRRAHVLEAFGKENLLVNRHQRKLYAELNTKMSGRDVLPTEAVSH